MLKLYIFYFVLGAYMLFQSFAIWIFSAFNGGDNIVTYLALFSSGMLFLVASGLSLYYLRWASIVGLVALIGVFPFGIHWLLYRYTYERPLTEGAFNQTMIIATVLYIISVAYSIKYIVRYKQALHIIAIKKPFKLSLAFLPACLFVVFAAIYIINP